MKGICLVSGGLDSTLSVIKLLQQGHTVVPMFVDYGQWSLEGELEAVDKILEWIKTNWKELGLVGELCNPIGSKIRLDITEDDTGIGSAWGRGIALVGVAAMWAYTHGDNLDFIALGNHKGDVGPDCKPGKFDTSLESSLEIATKGKMDLVLPIRGLSIEDIGIELGKLGFDFDLAFSCYWYPPCRYRSVNDLYLCPGCRRKVIAMKAAGVTNQEVLDYPNNEGDLSRSYQSSLADKVGY